MDPNKDLTLLATGGGTPECLAAVASGSVDATVITSPAEYAAEKQGLRIIMFARELGELVRIPITGIGGEPQDGSRRIEWFLRALRFATLYLLNTFEYSHGLSSEDHVRRCRRR